MTKPVALLLMLVLSATVVTASTSSGEPGQVPDDTLPDGKGVQDATLDVDLQELLSQLRLTFRQQLQNRLEALKQKMLEHRASRQRREEAEDPTSTPTPAPQEVAPSTDATAGASATTPTLSAQGRRHRKKKESSEEESSERKGRHGKGRGEKKDKYAAIWSGSKKDILSGLGGVRPLGPTDADQETGGRRGRGQKKKEEMWAFIAQMRARRKSTAATPTTAGL